jgi:hypothetical protein
MMKIRIVQAVGAYRKNEVLEAAEGQARLWIARGLAVEETQRPLLETATADPQLEHADATPRKRKRL